jgi:GDP-4-dehydro-6-deoxy-D-mannose reductase
MPVWWVTGASGFLGRHVLAQLARQVDDADGTAGGESTRLVALVRGEPRSGVETERIETIRLDVGDRDALGRAAERAAPDYVIHCAGRTPPAPEGELRRDNIEVTATLFAVLRGLARPIRVVLAGSAAELGPVNAYGRIKKEASRAALAEPPPIEPIVARIFNPIGPGIPEGQAFGRFARRLLESTADPLALRVGQLEARRDFVDIRDVARAMVALALRGRPRTAYQVGTGRSHRVGDGLNELIRLSGRAVYLEIDASLGSSRGPSDSRADIHRIRADVGWEPAISWERSLADLWVDARTGLIRDDVGDFSGGPPRRIAGPPHRRGGPAWPPHDR